MHEVFLKLWAGRQKLEIRNNFSAYLFRICHNQAYDATMKIARDRDLQAELLLFYPLYANGEIRSTEELERIDGLIEAALDKLSPQTRNVYQLCRKEGKSYQQAATALGISPHTVKEHMSRALTVLRAFLHEKGQLTLIIYLSQFFLRKN